MALRPSWKAFRRLAEEEAAHCFLGFVSQLGLASLYNTEKMTSGWTWWDPQAQLDVQSPYAVQKQSGSLAAQPTWYDQKAAALSTTNIEPEHSGCGKANGLHFVSSSRAHSWTFITHFFSAHSGNGAKQAAGYSVASFGAALHYIKHGNHPSRGGCSQISKENAFTAVYLSVPLAQQVLRPSVAVYAPAAQVQVARGSSLVETWAGLKQGLKDLRTADISFCPRLWENIKCPIPISFRHSNIVGTSGLWFCAFSSPPLLSVGVMNALEESLFLSTCVGCAYHCGTCWGCRAPVADTPKWSAFLENELWQMGSCFKKKLNCFSSYPRIQMDLRGPKVLKMWKIAL